MIASLYPVLVECQSSMAKLKKERIAVTEGGDRTVTVATWARDDRRIRPWRHTIALFVSVHQGIHQTRHRRYATQTIRDI